MTWPSKIPYQLKDPTLFRHGSLIGDSWIDAASCSLQTFPVYDPCTNEVIGHVPDITLEYALHAIGAAHEAFKDYKKVPPRSRKFLLRRWSELIKENAEDLAAICTLELGKPFAESLVTVKYGTDFLDWFESEAEHLYGETIPAAKGDNRIFTIREPQGVVAALTPWNSPVAMVTRKVGAAVAAGNTVVLKPAPETPYTAIALANLFLRAGFEPGVLNLITTSTHTQSIGQILSRDTRIAHLSFTGSTAIGKLLATQCASTLKKVSLELGGLAPFIVFPDANLSKAAEGLISSRFRSSGQTCVCAQRIYLHRSIHDKFLEILKEKLLMTFTYGSVWERATNFGPLYHQKGVEKVEYHIEDALANGATTYLNLNDTSAAANDKTKNMIRPVILTDVMESMVIANEETFGPVLGVMKFDTDEEVIQRANNTATGLAGYFYTESIERLWRVSEALEVGMVGARVGLISACEQPFGGIGDSGMGREGSRYALFEYVNIKSVTVGL